MDANINPLIGANVRETVENVSDALEGLIELLPEGVPLEITPEMHAKKTFIYSPANIAHKLEDVRNGLEEVAKNLGYEVIKASTLGILEKVGMTAPPELVSDDVEGDIARGIDIACDGLGYLVMFIANDHNGLCRLIDPLLHALEHAASEVHRDSGEPMEQADQALAECAA